ncbi:MAG: hypothetical protein RXR18_06790 [Nitrososphaeria archaeon]
MSEDDDKMLDVLINSADNRTELEKHMDNIAQELNDSFLNDNLQDVIENALDVILYVSLPDKEPVGFDIAITIGGPNIRLIYSRGACKLQGAWGSITDEKDVDNEICETILDYLTQA